MQTGLIVPPQEEKQCQAAQTQHRGRRLMIDTSASRASVAAISLIVWQMSANALQGAATCPPPYIVTYVKPKAIMVSRTVLVIGSSFQGIQSVPGRPPVNSAT